MAKKKVAEWLMYVKLADSKIDKAEKKLMDIITMVTNNSNYERNKEEIDRKKKEAEDLYKSYTKLIENKEKVRMAITRFNAATDIEVAGRNMPLAYALDSWNKQQYEEARISRFRNRAVKFENEKIMAGKVYTQKEEDWTKTIVGGTKSPSEKEREIIAEKIKGYEVIAIDPVDIKNQIELWEEKHQEFIQHLNMSINIANATNEIEINIEE